MKPQFPEFSEEYKFRWRKARCLMEHQGIDALFMSEEEGLLLFHWSQDNELLVHGYESLMTAEKKLCVIKETLAYAHALKLVI